MCVPERSVDGLDYQLLDSLEIIKKLDFYKIIGTAFLVSGFAVMGDGILRSFKRVSNSNYFRVIIGLANIFIGFFILL